MNGEQLGPCNFKLGYIFELIDEVIINIFMIKYQTMNNNNNNNSEQKDNPRSLHRIRHTWILRQFHALNQLSAFTL